MAAEAEHDAVVVGAGLAGLCAAVHLTAAGLDVAVLESATEVGGRVRTDVVDGLRLDRGFQVLNPSYPEAVRMLDLTDLDLAPFERAVQVAIGGRRHVLGDPRRHPGRAVDALRAPVGGPSDKARFLAYAMGCGRATPAELRSRPELSAAQALVEAGVGPALTDTVLRPFLSGVLLEDGLATSRRFVDLALRSFVRGTPGIPALGMGVVPRQLARRLPAGTVRLRQRVDAVRPGSVEVAGRRLRARAVVVATDGTSASMLLDARVVAPGWHGVVTWYHVTDADSPGSVLTGGTAMVAVDGQRRGPVVNSVVLTNAAPAYATLGRTLVSTSLLTEAGAGDEPSEHEVRAHLAVVHGVDTAGWQPVARYSVPHALPAMLPPLTVRHPVALGDGIYVCGDHRDTSSIQGAMVSGRRAAAAVLDDLRPALPKGPTR